MMSMNLLGCATDFARLKLDLLSEVPSTPALWILLFVFGNSFLDGGLALISLTVPLQSRRIA
jgi:hypothetical protein